MSKAAEAMRARLLEGLREKGAQHTYWRSRPGTFDMASEVLAERLGMQRPAVKKALQRFAVEGSTPPRNGAVVAHLAAWVGIDPREALEALEDPWKTRGYAWTDHALTRLERWRSSRSPGGRDTQLEPSVPPSAGGRT